MRKAGITRKSTGSTKVLKARTAQSLVDQARAILEELIVTLKLPPGSLWSESALSELTGIGRTPVREAVQKLSAAHLMEILPRHGVLVSEVNIGEQLLILEARRELERLISVLAARRASPAERAKLASMAAAVQQAGDSNDVIAYLRALFESDRYIASCSRNPYVAEVIAPLHTLSQRFYYAHHIELDDLRIAGELHAHVMRAIAAGDEAGAGAAADKMMDYVEQFTRTLIVRNFDSRIPLARPGGLSSAESKPDAAAGK